MVYYKKIKVLPKEGVSWENGIIEIPEEES